MCPKYSLYQQQKQLRLKVTVRLKTERSHPVSCLVAIYEKLCKCAFHNNAFFDEMKPLIYKMNNLLLTFNKQKHQIQTKNGLVSQQIETKKT